MSLAKLPESMFSRSCFKGVCCQLEGSDAKTQPPKFITIIGNDGKAIANDSTREWPCWRITNDLCIIQGFPMQLPSPDKSEQSIVYRFVLSGAGARSAALATEIRPLHPGGTNVCLSSIGKSTRYPGLRAIRSEIHLWLLRGSLAMPRI